jgi:hypothetical protein
MLFQNRYAPEFIISATIKILIKLHNIGILIAIFEKTITSLGTLKNTAADNPMTQIAITSSYFRNIKGILR